MTGTSLSIFLNAASAPRPSMFPGITMSSSTASGRSAWNRRRASSALVTVNRVVATPAEKRTENPAHREVVVNDQDLRLLSHWSHRSKSFQPPDSSARATESDFSSNQSATEEIRWKRTEFPEILADGGTSVRLKPDTTVMKRSRCVRGRFP